MAIKWVDSSASGANNGTSPADAWTSITSITVTAGDTVYIRRTHAESVAAQKVIAATGPTTLTKIVGWPISGDREYANRDSAGISAGWDSDSTASVPTITTTYTSTGTIYFSGTGPIYLSRFKIQAGSAAVTYLMRFSGSGLSIVEDCEFDRTSSTSSGNANAAIYVATSRCAIFANRCKFIGRSGTATTNSGVGVYFSVSSMRTASVIKDCVFERTGYSVYLTTGFQDCIYIINCDFGPTDACYVAGYFPTNAYVYFYRCTFNLIYPQKEYLPWQGIYSSKIIEYYENDDVSGAWESTINDVGYILKDTTVSRPGGSALSIKMSMQYTSANSYFWANSTFGPFEEFIYASLTYPPVRQPFSPQWSYYVPSAGTHTLTVYAKTSGFTTLPTVDALFFSVMYIDGSSALRVARSTEVVSVDDTWTAFSVTFTVGAAQFVQMKFAHDRYENPGDCVYLDPLPILS